MAGCPMRVSCTALPGRNTAHDLVDLGVAARHVQRFDDARDQPLVGLVVGELVRFPRRGSSRRRPGRTMPETLMRMRIEP